MLGSLWSWDSGQPWWWWWWAEGVWDVGLSCALKKQQVQPFYLILFQSRETTTFCHGGTARLTVEILNPGNVVFVQGEVLHIGVHGVHERLSNVGVIQTQRVAKLVGGHQEQAVTCAVGQRNRSSVGKSKISHMLCTLFILCRFRAEL